MSQCAFNVVFRKVLKNPIILTDSVMSNMIYLPTQFHKRKDFHSKPATKEDKKCKCLCGIGKFKYLLFLCDVMMTFDSENDSTTKCCVTLPESRLCPPKTKLI